MSGSADTYYCPMCPGQEQPAPGDCKVCGMALVQAFRLGTEDNSARESLIARKRFVTAAVLTAPVLALAMTADLAPSLALRESIGGWWNACLGIPACIVTFGPARILLERGARSIVAMRLNMFSLLALGILASLFVSGWSVLLPSSVPEALLHHGHPPLYFEAAATIATLALFGQWLEARSTRATGDALRCVLALAPKTVSVLRDQRETEMPLHDVSVGMHFRVRAGDRVALDGVVLEGESAVDESMLTGEPIPKRKAAGDTVIGGSLNVEGTLVVTATATGNDGFLADIAKCVTSAQSSRTAAQDLADSISALFVPLVLLLACGAAAGWYLFADSNASANALSAFIAILVVACPCALGLATPMAVTVAAGCAAREGILFRDVGVMERLAKSDLFVFDKTGTLSDGHPSIASISYAPGFLAPEVLLLAASAETGSTHPAARSLVQYAVSQEISCVSATEFVSIAGRGVRAIVLGKQVVVGNRTLAQLASPHALPETVGTSVFVVIDGAHAATIQLQDAPAHNANAVIESLQRDGVTTMLATGDNPSGATAFLRAAAIDESKMEIRAQLLPQEKATLISALRQGGAIVSFIGDGVNDTAALLRADAGISVKGASDAASAAAAIQLLRKDVALVLHARAIARTLSSTIRQNLALAFGYNLVAIPIAAGALYPLFHRMTDPMIAALAMSVSSFLVIANSLRQRRAHRS